MDILLKFTHEKTCGDGVSEYVWAFEHVHLCLPRKCKCVCACTCAWRWVIDSGILRALSEHTVGAGACVCERDWVIWKLSHQQKHSGHFQTHSYAHTLIYINMYVSTPLTHTLTSIRNVSTALWISIGIRHPTTSKLGILLKPF